MQYRLELEIEAPRSRVVELFVDPASLTMWQRDLVSFEQIGPGLPRHVGTMTRQVHRMGGREAEVIETITAHHPPEEYAATYEAPGVRNQISNRFTETPAQTTLWVLAARCEFSSPVMRLMAWALPGLFRGQARAFMESFKAFAERSVRAESPRP